QDEVAAVDRFAAVEVRRDRRRGAALARRRGGHRLRGAQPVLVDVVQRDLEAVQLGEGEEVAEQVAREDDAARADEGNARHPFLAPSVRPLTNWRCSAA